MGASIDRLLKLTATPKQAAATHGGGQDGGSGIDEESADTDQLPSANAAFAKAKAGGKAKINHEGTATYLHGGPVGVAVTTHAANGAVLHHGFIDQNPDGQTIKANPNGAPSAVLGSVHDAISHVKAAGKVVPVTAGDTALS